MLISDAEQRRLALPLVARQNVSSETIRIVFLMSDSQLNDSDVICAGFCMPDNLLAMLLCTYGPLSKFWLNSFSSLKAVPRVRS